MELEGACGSGRVGIIDDGLIGHELSDDVGQLSWVREVDCVSRSVDRDEDDAVFYLLRDFSGCAPGPASTDRESRQLTSVGTSKASSRSSDGNWVSARNIRKVLGTPNRR